MKKLEAPGDTVGSVASGTNENLPPDDTRADNRCRFAVLRAPCIGHVSGISLRGAGDAQRM